MCSACCTVCRTAIRKTLSKPLPWQFHNAALLRSTKTSNQNATHPIETPLALVQATSCGLQLLADLDCCIRSLMTASRSASSAASPEASPAGERWMSTAPWLPSVVTSHCACGRCGSMACSAAPRLSSPVHSCSSTSQSSCIAQLYYIPHVGLFRELSSMQCDMRVIS